MDADKSGGLECAEFCAAVRKLVTAAATHARLMPTHELESLVPLQALWASKCAERAVQDFTPRIHMSASDFASITQNGDLCDETGQLGPAHFEDVMRKQVSRGAGGTYPSARRVAVRCRAMACSYG